MVGRQGWLLVGAGYCDDGVGFGDADGLATYLGRYPPTWIIDRLIL